MNPNDNQPVAAVNPKQQVIERVRTAVNVLVTVSNDPSVDQLASAIGFTLMLNKLGKHATTVFSGNIPSTIEFLKPEATIEKNTDSLRDFIVSLDKSKADKLRYKVEENVVKIFITPYRTSISEKDLQFSQGDFNVDAVIALGVSDQKQLDQAITAHGRILHDATVITVSAGGQGSSLGAINWQDAAASSLSEMLIGVGDALQPNLLDTQEATAFLTGIVAQTERFSNAKTTPRIMSLAAQLMAAGANQQLIATQLENATEVPLKPGDTPLTPASQSPDGSLRIEHEGSKEELEDEEHKLGEIAIDEHGNMSSPAEAAKAPSEEDNKHQLLDGNGKMLEPDKDHPFSSTMSEGENMDKSLDPLTVPPDASAPPTPGKTEINTPSLIEGQIPVGTIPPTLDDNTLRDIEKAVTSRHIASDPTSTLNEIEESVESPHVGTDTPAHDDSGPSVLPPVGGLDAARDAVVDAISAAPYDPNRPEPRQSLNATDTNLPLGGSDSGSAPLVLPEPAVSAGPDLTGAPSSPVPSGPLPPYSDTTTMVMPTIPPLNPDPSSQPTPGGPPPVPPPLTLS